MAWNISQCKQMIEMAKDTGSILSIGHQRHYSLLYAHAHEVVKSGVLGDVMHIRRPVAPQQHLALHARPEAGQQVAAHHRTPDYRDGWFPPVLKEDYEALNDKAKHQEVRLRQRGAVDSLAAVRSRRAAA